MYILAKTDPQCSAVSLRQLSYIAIYLIVGLLLGVFYVEASVNFILSSEYTLLAVEI